MKEMQDAISTRLLLLALSASAVVEKAIKKGDVKASIAKTNCLQLQEIICNLNNRYFSNLIIGKYILSKIICISIIPLRDECDHQCNFSKNHDNSRLEKIHLRVDCK
ncbi:MAG TPA: hypothetical protein VL122_13390 [Nitrospirota bacterium]|nr:hypothetical protein [Nitrospirota bacterium]